ncbi:MAG TPA: hypothetical protein VKC53_00550 [Patescibacteria group bacterium]|nr:hypothetical protein [Patescibacteria group bacterium]
MQKLSKFVYFVFFLLTFVFCFLYPVLQPGVVNAQIPKLRLPCTDDGKNPEFNSLRPYQAAPCGDAGKALYCSNDLIFTEDFDFAGQCGGQAPAGTGNFTCKLNGGLGSGLIPAHTLYVTLDNSQFPIEGNTEQVKNSQNSSDSLDDATKVNEYVSWYLSGVTGHAENGASTNDQVVNYSGPLKKLLPGAIQDNARIQSINKATNLVRYPEESDTQGQADAIVTGPETHNQIVVCANKQILGINNPYIGSTHPYPCYKGDGSAAAPENEIYRLKTWDKGTLSFARTTSEILKDFLRLYPGITQTVIDNLFSGQAWNKKTPPLPWDDVGDGTGKPFASSNLYLKAYNEWRGKSCIIVPYLNVPLCFDNPGVTNEYADLFSYVPLAVTPDKKGAEYVADVQIKPSQGTELSSKTYDPARNAPLYFAHTQETSDSSNLLNTTYTPKGYKSQPVPATTEKNECSIVNVRTNAGDNLFPGDPDEIQVPGVTYTISSVECKQTVKESLCIKNHNNPEYDGKTMCIQKTLECNAEVIITLITNTKTPSANELFSSTVADSGSTFRKIYPKVGEGSPISCIADIPTVTDVTYDSSKSQPPLGGDQTFKVRNNPKDGASGSNQLTFPHIGSVYEYFLKGIQAALRPKGYSDPIVDGQLCYTNMCTPVSGLPKASGSCALGGSLNRIGVVAPSLKAVVEAAAQTYKVPPGLILGVMYGEGVFNTNFYKNEANVKDFASCRPLPNCNANASEIKSIVPFIKPYWDNLAKEILPDLKKIDPKKTKADPCNLLDATFGLAKDLHDNAGGSASITGNSCYGIPMTSTNPGSCSWDNSQYETAIRVWEIGTEYDVASQKTCLTTPGTCESGIASGSDYTSSLCPGGDNCETLGSSGNTSHNACVFDVSTSGGSGNKK